MIVAVFNKFSLVLIGLFLVLLALKLTVFPNMYWTAVGFPLYGPPVISLALAMCQEWKYRRRWFDNFI